MLLKKYLSRIYSVGFTTGQLPSAYLNGLHITYSMSFFSFRQILLEHRSVDETTQNMCQSFQRIEVDFQ